MGVASLAFWNLPSVTTELWVYILLFGVSGLPGSALGIGLVSSMQQLSPAGMLGRVVGIAGALDALACATGSLAAGLLLNHTKLVVLLDIQAVIYIVCGILALLLLRERATTLVSAADQHPGST